MNMKPLLLACCGLMLLAGCQSRLFRDVPADGNGQPVYPLRLHENPQRVLLTDYYPRWEEADSVTGRDGIVVTAAADDWSAFDVAAPEELRLSTLDVWRGGRSLSIVVLKGEHDPSCRMYTAGAMLKVVTVAAEQRPERIVAMWQNCRLPDDGIVSVEGAFGVIVPKDAREMERSCLRIYAAGEKGLYNDVLVPLSYGRIVRDPKQLNRHDPQTQVLYSLMIDRFQNGNPANDAPLNRPDVRPEVDYMGGDLKGITDKIEEGFFDDLGVTTIWISPVTQNPRDAWGQNVDPDTRFSGYHGYWPIYATRIDDRFGTDAELRELLATAHDHGMNVILDYVANHLHIDSPVLQEHPDWTTSMYLPDGRRNLELWDEQRLTTWFDVHIPTLDLEREEVCDPMTDSALYWVANYDFDGFRHDACKHIPENYWRMLCRKMKSRFPDRQLWQIGETYGSPELIGSYVKSGMIDAQFDFNFYHTAIDVLREDAPLKRIADEVATSEAAYGSHHTMGNITGNHDKARFISLAGGALSPWEDHKQAGWHREVGVGDPVGYRKLALLQALIMTLPGVPCIYQGDEYGQPGANDPDNRHMMRFDGYDEAEQAQRELTRELIALRRGSMPLLYGDLITLHTEGNCWVFVREYMGEYVVAAFNNGASACGASCTIPAGFSLSRPMESRFGSEFGFDAETRTLTLRLEPYSFELLTALNPKTK